MTATTATFWWRRGARGNSSPVRPPVVDTNSRKPCRIAQDEIRAGKVKWEIPDTRTAAEAAGEALDKALGQD